MNDDIWEGCNRAAIVANSKIRTCRYCKHRKRYRLNYNSNKVVQYCELQPSKRSNSGFKTIKVTDSACSNYEREEK